MSSRNPGRHSAGPGTADGGWKAAVAVSRWWYGVVGRLDTAARPHDRERGDVPGWVMITLMSAILVAGLLFVAEPALRGMFNSAMEQVKP